MRVTPLRIHKISEVDFDQIVVSAGGKRIEDTGEPKGAKNADYLFEDFVAELKFVEEEGLNKPERQRKIAELFVESFPDFPVLVVDPYVLEAEPQRKLFRILEGPIKNLVKKSSKQLGESAERFEVRGRVLLIVNSGYMSLRHDDFKKIVKKCVINDTSSVDVVVICGIYYEYDGFESYLFANFEPFHINGSIDIDLEPLNEKWNQFVSDRVADSLIKQSFEADSKSPISDVSFDFEGKTFVRPRRQVGKPSPFFIHGRPRANSTGIEECPCVANVIPEVKEGEWEMLKGLLTDPEKLPQAAARWKEIYLSTEEPENRIRPIVFLRVSVPTFHVDMDSRGKSPSLEDLKWWTAEQFNDRCRSLIDDATELPESLSLGGRYIVVATVEIGSDKAFDFSSIFLISDIPGFESETVLVENERIFFDHALALGAAYAIRHECHNVFTLKNTDFGWS